MESDKKYRRGTQLQESKRHVAERNFFGIDKEIDLVKIAKAYMAIIGDGRGNIVRQNTLSRPDEFNEKARDTFVASSGPDRFRTFDLILTNPPFGVNTKVVKSDASQFVLGHAHAYDSATDEFVKSEKARDTEAQLLFIERCLQMLANGV